MIAPIDSNATTFDSSQDEDEVSGADVLSLSGTVAVAASGNDRGASTFLRTEGRGLACPILMIYATQIVKIGERHFEMERKMEGD